jgi:predicted phosphodiesterase
VDRPDCASCIDRTKIDLSESGSASDQALRAVFKGEAIVKVLIIADVHGNLEALDAVLADPHDALICLGDMVGYGPDPGACVRRIMGESPIIVRGNHDHAVATGAAPGCLPSFHWLAQATAQLAAVQLSEGERADLAGLPLRESETIDGALYHLVHATPSDPMYGYLEPGCEAWTHELRDIDPGILLVGHTHLPFRHEVAGHTLLHPGSVGQPRQGDPRASYIVIEDGNISFCRAVYPVERTVAKLERSGIEPAAAAVLGQLLRTGQPTLFLTPPDAPRVRPLTRKPASHVPDVLERRLRGVV